MKLNFLLASTIFASLTQIFLKYLMLELRFSTDLFQIISSKFLWVSLLTFIIQTIFWFISLKNFPLGFAFLINSLSIVIIYTYSIFFFSEDVSLYKVIGVFFIFFGIFILNVKSFPKKILK